MPTHSITCDNGNWMEGATHFHSPFLSPLPCPNNVSPETIVSSSCWRVLLALHSVLHYKARLKRRSPGCVKAAGKARQEWSAREVRNKIHQTLGLLFSRPCTPDINFLMPLWMDGADAAAHKVLNAFLERSSFTRRSWNFHFISRKLHAHSPAVLWHSFVQL